MNDYMTAAFAAIKVLNNDEYRALWKALDKYIENGTEPDFDVENEGADIKKETLCLAWIAIRDEFDKQQEEMGASWIKADEKKSEDDVTVLVSVRVTCRDKDGTACTWTEGCAGRWDGDNGKWIVGHVLDFEDMKDLSEKMSEWCDQEDYFVDVVAWRPMPRLYDLY